MSNHVPYPHYKESGVAWLGVIPAGWEVKRLKYALEINPKKSEVSALKSDTLVSFLPMEKIGEDGLLDLSETRPISDVYKGFTYLQDGDVIVAKITPCFENGKGGVAQGLSNRIGFGTTELHVLRPQATIDAKFIFYWTRTHLFRNAGIALMTGAAGQKRVPETYISDFSIPIPTLVEQRTIAAFLDRKTTRLDTLINHKRELIKRLQEKRTALISHAVTRGLNPAAPMKDSGVAWLREIPSGWEVTKIKHLSTKIGSGKTPKGGAERYTSEGIIFLRSQNIHFDGIRLDEVAYIDKETDNELATTRVNPSDVLLNITGASIGRCAVVPVDFPEANVNQHVCIIRVRQGLLEPTLLSHILSSVIVQSQIYALEVGASREGLTFDEIGNLIIAISEDLEEQRAIVDYLKRETTKIDDLIKRVETGIEQLEEYRTSLITAAVTGKINVQVT